MLCNIYRMNGNIWFKPSFCSKMKWYFGYCTSQFHKRRSCPVGKDICVFLSIRNFFFRRNALFILWLLFQAIFYRGRHCHQTSSPSKESLQPEEFQDKDTFSLPTQLRVTTILCLSRREGLVIRHDDDIIFRTLPTPTVQHSMEQKSK